MAMITLLFGALAAGILIITGGSFHGFGAGFGLIVIIFELAQVIFRAFGSHIKHMVAIEHVWLERFYKSLRVQAKLYLQSAKNKIINK